MIILYVVIAVLVIIIFTKLYIQIKYIKNENEEDFFIKILLFGKLIRFTVRPKKDVKKRKDKKISKIIDRLNFLDNIKEYLRILKKIISFVLKHIIIEKLKIKIDIGTKDAAATGMITGILWSVLYNVVAINDKIFNLNEYSIDINPDFSNEKLDIHIDSILSVRPVNIILISISVLYIFIVKVSKDTNKNKKIVQNTN